MSTFAIVLVVVLVSTVGVVLVAQADDAQRATGDVPPDGGRSREAGTARSPAATAAPAVERPAEPVLATTSFAPPASPVAPGGNGERPALPATARTWRPELSIEVPAPAVVAPVAVVLIEVDEPAGAVLAVSAPTTPETAAFRAAAEEVLALVADDEGEDEARRERLVDEVRPARVRSTLALVFLLAATGVVLAAAVGAVAALVALGLRRAAGVG